VVEPIELKVKRIKAGLRQYQVAAEVGVAPCRLSEIETGRRQPSPELVQRILEVIGDNGNNSHKKETK
jgi:transcriptional regulator with XRE-family HTH domain